MTPKSLAIQTDLIFGHFFGEVLDRGSYIVVKTTSRPHFFWGNYLVMPEPPVPGALPDWIARYGAEFDYKKQGFMAIAVDSPFGEVGSVQEFLDFGFHCHTNKVLTTSSVVSPPKFNSLAEVREIKSEADWAQVVEVHYSDEWYLNPDSQRPFIEKQMSDLRRMCEAGKGKRFGAFLDGRLVADLGIYNSNGVGRFNEVATHREYRRQGLCGTLVYEASHLAFKSMDVHTLVMEADEDYHAAAIYESVGFKPNQRVVGFEWFDKSIHG